jgi:hypothetical protein
MSRLISNRSGVSYVLDSDTSGRATYHLIWQSPREAVTVGLRGETVRSGRPSGAEAVMAEVPMLWVVDMVATRRQIQDLPGH